MSTLQPAFRPKFVAVLEPVSQIFRLIGETTNSEQVAPPLKQSPRWGPIERERCLPTAALALEHQVDRSLRCLHRHRRHYPQ